MLITILLSAINIAENESITEYINFCKLLKPLNLKYFNILNSLSQFINISTFICKLNRYDDYDNRLQIYYNNLESISRLHNNFERIFNELSSSINLKDNELIYNTKKIIWLIYINVLLPHITDFYEQYLILVSCCNIVYQYSPLWTGIIINIY